MGTLALVVLAVLAVAAFVNLRAGTLGAWLSAKFLNEGEPAPAQARPDAGAPREGVARPGGVPFFAAPAPGPVISGFGAPRDEGRRRHEGIDIGAPRGTPVTAAAPGRVAQAGFAGRCGRRVAIDHGDGWRTLYCHLDTIDARSGATVRAGERVGTVGTSGNAEDGPPHLHFEVHRNGEPLDPAPLLAAAGVGVAA